MPKRDDIDSILILGSGPIVIGQACEFDYSGAQACKVLRREGYRVILVNSNPATIMTDPEFADATYIEPITKGFVEKVIAKERRERPDEKLVVLPTLGGQTGLNVAVELAEAGVLDAYDIELIGAGLESINLAEDRRAFNQAMTEIGLEQARATIRQTMTTFPDLDPATTEKLSKDLDLIADQQAKGAFLRGEFYRRTGYASGAEHYYGEVRARWPKSEWAAKAQEQLASLAKVPRKIAEPSRILTLPGAPDPNAIGNSMGSMAANPGGSLGGAGAGGP